MEEGRLLVKNTSSRKPDWRVLFLLVLLAGCFLGNFFETRQEIAELRQEVRDLNAAVGYLHEQLSLLQEFTGYEEPVSITAVVGLNCTEAYHCEITRVYLVGPPVELDEAKSTLMDQLEKADSFTTYGWVEEGFIDLARLYVLRAEWCDANPDIVVRLHEPFLLDTKVCGFYASEG